MRVVLEDYGHYATGRKPRQGEDALLILTSSRPRLGVDSAINLAERVRDVGVQVVVAAQSVEGLGDHRQAPGSRLLRRRDRPAPVPGPRAAPGLAGQERVPLEHNWELDFYGPRGLAKARMGERPRIDPEAVRQAHPVRPGSSRPASTSTCRCSPATVRLSRSELAVTSPLTDADTITPHGRASPSRDRRRRRPRRSPSVGSVSG